MADDNQGTFGQGVLSALPLVGGIFSAIGQRKGQERQFKYDKKLAEMQFQQQKRMWDEANAYNTPQMQMERFKAAGLNPNLIYGSGSASSGSTSTSLPVYSQSRTKMDYNVAQALPDMISRYQDIKLRQAQIDQAQEAIQAQEINNASKAMDLEAKRNYGVPLITKDMMSKHQQLGSDTWYKRYRATKLGLDVEQSSELSRYFYSIAKARAEGEMAKTLKLQRQADWLKLAPSGSPLERLLYGMLNQSGLSDLFMNSVKIRKRKK